MPIRSYQCEKCGQKYDDLYWNKYPKSIKCPNCEGRASYRFVDTHYERWGDRQPKRYKVDFRSGEYDWGAGKVFNSKKERDQWMVASDCVRRKDME